MATIFIGPGNRVTGWEFSGASGIYRNPSFLVVESEPFTPIRTAIPLGPHGMRFRQTCGARTVTPERVGEIAAQGVCAGVPVVGPLIPPALCREAGRAVAHAVENFPPIWATIELDIHADGRSEGRTMACSLFPSMIFYLPLPSVAGTYNIRGAAYDARPNLQRWRSEGWGSSNATSSGVTPGNPWGIASDFDARRSRQRRAS